MTTMTTTEEAVAETEEAVADVVAIYKQGVGLGIQHGWLLATGWLNKQADTWDKFKIVGAMMNIDPLTLRKDQT